MGSDFTDRYKDSFSYGVAIALTLLGWWLDVAALRIVLGIAALTLVLWPLLHRRFNMTVPMVLAAVSFVGLIFGVIGQLAFYGFNFAPHQPRPAADLSANEGVLLPGSEPTPAMPPNCPIPEDALKVFYGTNVSWTRQFPFSLVEMGGEAMVVVDRNRDGDLIVSVLKIFDQRNEILARIDEDGFWVRNDLRKKRPDASTLVVYDRSDQEVTRIKLHNPHALSISGIFRRPGMIPVIISEKSLQFGASVISGNCNAGAYSAAIVLR